MILVGFLYGRCLNEIDRKKYQFVSIDTKHNFRFILKNYLIFL